MKANTSRSFLNDVSIVLCGEAGLGTQTVEHMLTRVLKTSGYNLYAAKEFMSRIRGGANSTSIRVSSSPVYAYEDRMDILIPLSKGAVKHVEKRISRATLVMGEEALIKDEYSGQNVVYVPLTQIASEVGGRIYANTIAGAMIAGMFEVEVETLELYLRDRFGGKGEQIVRSNIDAAHRGHRIGADLVREGRVRIGVKRHPEVKDHILMNGAEAMAMGALAGGCNFIAFYPMTPSTAVSTLLARHSEEFGIVVEQAEDEIAAMNMGLGAWYAGGRAMASTAGGGFALMVEGLSLAGMIESPMVINIGQRPAPATGLPTRTEQADLLFALYAGHGEFPRIIFAPGTLQETFLLTQKAFNLADKYQVPAILLTDQYLMDSYYNMPFIDVTGLAVEKNVVRTDSEYIRYRLTEDGISPRGIPGHGDGLVCLDSDEHDEFGRITEDDDVRRRMVEKRLKKLRYLVKDSVPPTLWGDEGYESLVIGWGSTYGALREAVGNLKRSGVALLHFSQVYPLHPRSSEYLEKCDRTILVEGNATSQFGHVLALETGHRADRTILKYDGLPFSVEELRDRLGRALIQEA